MKAFNKVCSPFLLILVLLVSLPLTSQQDTSTSRASAEKKSTKAKKQPGKADTKRPRVINDLSGFDLLDPAKTKKQPMVAGATRGISKPIALAPRLARLYTPYPTFRWSYRGNETKFDFVLYDANQNEIYRKVVDGLDLQYPDSAPPLKAEKAYFWTVAAQSILGSEPSVTVGFVVMSDAQRKHLSETLTSLSKLGSEDDELAKARVLTDKRLWYDAIDAYFEMISKQPGRADLYSARAQIYAQLDVTRGNADLDFSRAEEIEKAVVLVKQSRD